MALTLSTTGMDAAVESEFRSAFDQANRRTGGAWSLAQEADARHVVVDMDSMYGPMSWIRLHAAGKQVIGLTTAPRTQTDHHLARPVDVDGLARLLAEIAETEGVPLARAPEAPQPSVETPQPAPASGPASTPASAASAQPPIRIPDATPQPAAAAPAIPATPQASAPEPLHPAVPHGNTPAPAPMDQLPEETPLPADEEAAPPPEPAAALQPAHAAALAESTGKSLADWLAPGALAGRWRLRSGGATLLFDADARVYHGPASLKPLAPAFEGTVEREDFETLDPAAWSGAIADQGGPQPLIRLQWLGALLAGKGALLPIHDPAGRYRLLKWPQTEREYPKHFRISTTMMKGPATLDEITAASGVAYAEVADFVNATLATGYAERVLPPPAAPVEPPRSGGLFGRIRGR